MDVLLPNIRNWFLSNKEHFTAFAQADSRIEGWFKAELIVLLNELVRQGKIESYKREVNIPSPINGKRKQVDFQLYLKGKEHLCELKALCISQAAGTPRNLHFYFRDDHLGLIKDFRKLDELDHPNKWVLAFIYPAPKLDEWRKELESLPRTLKHWTPVTKLNKFPEWVYISLWKG